jgi:hypothetical protein
MFFQNPQRVTTRHRSVLARVAAEQNAANHVLSKRQLTLNALQSWNCDISEKGSAANIDLCL